MSELERANVPVPSVVRYVAVSVALLGGFFGLLVAAAHPVPAMAAVAGVAVGVLAGRARERAESYARRLAAAGEPTEPTAEPT